MLGLLGLKDRQRSEKFSMKLSPTLQKKIEPLKTVRLPQSKFHALTWFLDIKLNDDMIKLVSVFHPQNPTNVISPGFQ
jgi:hypothetical protein